MRAPPPVTVSGAVRPSWRVIVASLWAMAAASVVALAGMLQWPDAASLVSGAAVAAAGAVGFLAARAVRAAPDVQWDGHAWSATIADGHTMQLTAGPDVIVDLDRWMLLRWPAACSARWVAVSADADPATWHRLRAAVYGGRVDSDPSAALPG